MKGTWAHSVWIAAVVGVLSLASPAGASTLPGSTTFAGYTANPPAGVVRLTAQLTVPTIDCASTGGGGIHFAVSINQGSGGAPGAVLDVVCTETGQGSIVFLTVPRQVATFAVAPGDKVVLRVYNDDDPAAPRQRASYSDLTTGASSALHAGKTVIANNTASVGAFGSTPIPDFGKVTWVKVAMNGSPFGSFGPTGTNLVNSFGQVLVRTSALSPSGGSFTNAWARSS